MPARCVIGFVVRWLKGSLSFRDTNTRRGHVDVGDPIGSGKRLLDPIDRVSEILFGLIMVLTFTGSLSVAEAGHAEVREMLVGALGCNLAWGFIDGIFYLMISLADRGRALASLLALRREADPATGQHIIASSMPPLLASVTQPAELESMRQRLLALSEPAARARIPKRDWLGALGVFLIVFLSTFPVVIPFTFLHDVTLALRVSNAIAIVMLFITGYAYGRMTGRRPIVVGTVMVILGLLLVSATIALGG